MRVQWQVPDFVPRQLSEIVSSRMETGYEAQEPTNIDDASRKEQQNIVPEDDSNDVEAAKDDSSKFTAGPANEIETRSDVADDGLEHDLEGRRVSFVVPMPVLEGDKPPNTNALVPEFSNDPHPDPIEISPKTEAKRRKNKSDYDTQEQVPRSATPIQLTLPSGFARAPSRQSRPGSGTTNRSAYYGHGTDVFGPITYEPEILEDVPEVPLRSRSRASNKYNSRPNSRLDKNQDPDDLANKKHTVKPIQPHEVPFNPLPQEMDWPQNTEEQSESEDDLEEHAQKHVQYAVPESVPSRSPSRLNHPARPASMADHRAVSTGHAYCQCTSRPVTPVSPTAVAAATVPKTQSVRTNIDKYRIEQIALRRLRFVIENSQAEPEHLAIMNLVEAGNVPRSVFMKFFGSKHQTAHEVRVLLLQSIERTQKIRRRQSRLTRGSRRARTTSPWNREPEPDPFDPPPPTRQQRNSLEEETLPLDPKVIAKHAREAVIRQVQSRRGVRTPGDLLTILDQVDREKQAVKEGRAKTSHTVGSPTNSRKTLGTRKGPPPPPDLCAEFDRLLQLEQKKMQALIRQKKAKARAEERRRLGQEVDDVEGEDDAEYLKSLELEKVTGDPEIRQEENETS
ncbi:hypothetical protein HDU96_006953 [Phlyctochytrium bullatum]|nr:hypothetical protein HDU96_006953 [Phlyctochytrium bullatum]